MAHRLSAALREQALWIAPGGMLLSLLVGVALAAQPAFGLALLLAPVYVVIVFVNLSVGLALWVPLAFLEHISALNIAGKAVGLLVAVVWLGSLQSLPDTAIAALRRHRLLLVILAGTLAWLTFSLTWSVDPGLGFKDLWHWYVLALLFLIILTTVTTARVLRLILAGFVAGAVISVAIGVFDGSLVSSLNGGVASTVNSGDRFAGSAGDPNFLAADLIPAIVLAAAFLSDTRLSAVRWLLLGAVALLVAGLVATESRGGWVAAAATIVAAFILFRRRRRGVAVVAAVAVCVAALTFVSSPGTWHRVTNFSNDNGRGDLRTVAWRMGKDEPMTGVGLNNFELHSTEYVREPGALEHVDLIVDRPHVAHNTYLQLFAEEGVVGLALFLGVVGACLRAAKLAADRFDTRGEASLATLSRAVIVATIGILATDLTLSAATEKPLWILLATGPALLTVASQARIEAPLADERSWTIEPSH